jgi:hypothetical protein
MQGSEQRSRRGAAFVKLLQADEPGRAGLEPWRFYRSPDGRQCTWLKRKRTSRQRHSSQAKIAMVYMNCVIAIRRFGWVCVDVRQQVPAGGCLRQRQKQHEHQQPRQSAM